MRENNKLGLERAISDAFVYTTSQIGNVASQKDAFYPNKGYENNTRQTLTLTRPLSSEGFFTRIVPGAGPRPCSSQASATTVLSVRAHGADPSVSSMMARSSRQSHSVRHNLDISYPHLTSP